MVIKGLRHTISTNDDIGRYDLATINFYRCLLEVDFLHGSTKTDFRAGSNSGF